MKRQKLFKYCLLQTTLALLFHTATVIAEEDNKIELPDLDTLIAEADLVAVAQLDDTRYQYIRGFPSEGEAWLTALFVYKSTAEVSTIVVYDKGVKGSHCYFPDTDLWQEGNRFLVFLKHTENLMYRGLTPVCYLPISVSNDNQYILRMPADNVLIPEVLSQQIDEYKFLDAGSRIDATELNRPERSELIATYSMVDEGDTLVYTQGIHITAVRKYIRARVSN